jgi:hypothetical protein
MVARMRTPQKVVIHNLDKSLRRGHAHFFFHMQDRMEMTDLDGARQEVDLRQVKAVFFVKRFEGDPDYPERQEFGNDSPVFGQKIRVVFTDGETLLGRAMGYRPEEKGFFLKPADPRSNNEMIFVPVTALREVRAGEMEPDAF